VTNAMTISRAAAAARVSADAVRYYERLRLLSPAQRTAAGYRVFGQDEIDRIRAIKHAQSLGLTLAEIKKLFPLSALGRTECRRVRGLLAAKIAETEARVAALRRLRSMLRAQLRACDQAIARGGEVQCPVFAPT